MVLRDEFGLLGLGVMMECWNSRCEWSGRDSHLAVACWLYATGFQTKVAVAPAGRV